MAVYKIRGSFEEYYEAVIEADTEDIAQEIFRQKAEHLTAVDYNWVDVTTDEVYEDVDDAMNYGESVEYTMDDYEGRYALNV